MDGVKLWHDDVRPAPEGWVWARTNQHAMEVLADGQVTHLSLDHDMGNHDLPPGTYDGGPTSGSGMPQKGLDTGMDVVRWMVKEGIFPPWIRVHAWNPTGGRNMHADLVAAGATWATHQPYRHGEVLSL